MNSYDHTGAIDLGLFDDGEVRVFYNPDRDVLAFVDDDTGYLVTLSRGHGSVVKAREATKAIFARSGGEVPLSVSPPGGGRSQFHRTMIRRYALLRLPRVPASVIEEAEDSVEFGAEAGIEYCETAVVQTTVIYAEPMFYSDLAHRLRDTADDYCSGSRTTCDSSENREFVAAADRRLAKCLRRWADKCERIGKGCEAALGR